MKELTYKIPHITIGLNAALENNRIRFFLDDKELDIKGAAKEYFRRHGYWVMDGSQVNVFLSMLTANFADTFFADVCRNYVGPDTDHFISALGRHCQKTISDGYISQAHINMAVTFASHYYKVKTLCDHVEQLADGLMHIPTSQQASLIELYQFLGYRTKGIPNLFIMAEDSFCFCEVKSKKGSLNAEQYIFAEYVLTRLPDKYQVVRVVDNAGYPILSDTSAKTESPLVSSLEGVSPQNKSTANGENPTAYYVFEESNCTDTMQQNVKEDGGDVGRIKQLKREQQYEEAATLLKKCIDETERGAIENPASGVAPWYYEQLAIIYRKEKRFWDEVSVLERYESKPKAPGTMAKQLAERLVKARQLAKSNQP